MLGVNRLPGRAPASLRGSGGRAVRGLSAWRCYLPCEEGSLGVVGGQVERPVCPCTGLRSSYSYN